jgi:phage tail-like protein
MDGTVVLFDEARQAVMCWQFTRGWPCQFSGSGFNATDNAIAIETLQICHEGLTID